MVVPDHLQGKEQVLAVGCASTLLRRRISLKTGLRSYGCEMASVNPFLFPLLQVREQGDTTAC
jgi:hypothetical protein